jgi:integrase
MAVVPRKRKGGKVMYGVLTSWPGGKPHWELVGPNKREAEALDRQRKREVKDGTFRPGEMTGESSVAAYAALWLAGRTNRAADLDRVAMRGHVLSRSWFANLPMSDVRPKHVLKLIAELKAQGTLAPKTITNLMALVRVMFRDAAIEEVVAASPYVVPRGVLKRSGKKRAPYTPAEFELLVSEVVGERERVWNALAFFLGLRLGEVCGLRWGDYDLLPKPLGAMNVVRQYVDSVLKTERPRVAPVHPFLAEVLRAWRARWSLHFLRQPGPDDAIVPVADGSPMTRSSAYKMWLRSCKAAGVDNRSVHSTRHTFITLTQRGGADRRIVELITHNPKQEIIDVYTTRDWSEFCAVVLCLPVPAATPVQPLDAALHASSKSASNWAPTQGLEPRVTEESSGDSGKGDESSDDSEPPLSPGILESDAALDARTESEAFDVALREHLGAAPPREVAVTAITRRARSEAS